MIDEMEEKEYKMDSKKKIWNDRVNADVVRDEHNNRTLTRLLEEN